MNVEYIYLKKRALFGKPCVFISEGPTVIDNHFPDKTLAEKYLVKPVVDKGIQESPVFAVHETNTWRADFTDRGMNHDQGGWPKDLNILDEEAVFRYKKKLEREENYIESLRQLSKPIEHAVRQNNAINIYQKYFDDVIKMFSANETLSQIRTIFRDTDPMMRPISHLSWSPDGGTAFVSSYCNMKFQMMEPGESTEACIWNVELPNSPQIVFDSKIPIVTLEWNPMDKNVLVGGLYNGAVATYDIRKAPEHVGMTPDTLGHRDPVHSVIWTNSKTGVDFFSTSSDGVVKWWDCRFLNRYTDSIILDMSKNQNISQAVGASCLEYDPTVPAKYLVGTENGFVICGNRKGTTLSEKLPWMLKTHAGPIYALERNANFSKIYLTVGDGRARIWSEDCKESPIIWTENYRPYLTGGGWSKSRYSVFFLTRADGYLDLWDLLAEQKHPYLSLKVSNKPLTAIRMDESGKFTVVGDEDGRVYLIQYGESLSTCLKNDKMILSAMFDREARREKILETRMKEIRLAMKLRALQAEGPEESKTTITKSQDEELKRVEEIYWEEVNKALDAEKRVQEVEKPQNEEVKEAISVENEIEIAQTTTE